MDAATQTEAVEEWVMLTREDEYSELCAELLAENEVLQEQMSALEERLSSAQLDGAHTEQARSRPSPMDRGYLVLRTPPQLGHLRGWHRTTWSQLLARPGLAPNESRAGFYIRLFTDRHAAEQLWEHQRLMPPIPVDPR